MTTRSLILSPHEVRAALDNLLGLVVRPVKPQPIESDDIDGLRWRYRDEPDWPCPHNCPLGVHGDRLWCRETYCFKRLSHIPKTHTEVKCSEGPCYRGVTGGLFCHRDMGRDGTGSPLWMSPATMPAWASRITLEVVGVRCVRVQELTEEDAMACGSYLGRCPCAEMNRKPQTPLESKFRQTWCHVHGEEFRSFWNAKYAKRGLGWETNPFVWAVEVRRVEG